MKKRRLDAALIAAGRVENAHEAFIAVTEGAVFVNNRRAISPAELVGPDDAITMRTGGAYVGRGAHKLEAALEEFGIDVRGKVCADIGSAVGGFVEVLLERGAAKVYAIDTARGKLALKLREDPRVVVMEETDARGLRALSEKIDLVTGDVSLISLRSVLPAVRRFAPGAEVVMLFKPQYETRNPLLLRHGVLKDDAAREALVRDFVSWAAGNNWRILGRMPSPIRGSKGNIEYLFYLKPPQ